MLTTNAKLEAWESGSSTALCVSSTNEESVQGVEVRFTRYLGFKESSDSGTSETYQATTISAVKEKSSL